MQVRVFSIPMEGDDDAQEDCNRFLRAHKVLSIEKVAVVAQGRQFWSLCVEYLPRRVGDAGPAGRPPVAANDTNRPRIDYRELLTAPQFERFSKLRNLRKQLAEREAVPVYTVFTNAQLAEIARRVPRSRAALGAVDGVGAAKVDRYGEALLSLLGTMPDPEPGDAAIAPSPEGGAEAAVVFLAPATS